MTEFSVLAVSPSDPDAPEKFAKSLRETGFAVIKDHDIDMSEINAMYDVWQPYFADDKKLNDATDMGDPSGYFGYKSENAKGAAQKDLKEFYHVYQKNNLPDGVSDVTKNFHSKMVGYGTFVARLARSSHT